MAERQPRPAAAAAPWRRPHLPSLPDPWPRVHDFVPEGTTPAVPRTPEPDAAAAELEHEQDAKVTLAGRVGKKPTVRKTRKGQLVAQFPLAVAVDDETWDEHTVLAFGERATKVGRTLGKDDDVELIGYRHTRDITTPDGERKAIREVYAARIIRTATREVIA